MKLAKYSMGIGDRFGRQGPAQLRAVMKAAAEGLPIDPVWNKSHREHTIIGTVPADVQREAQQAVAACRWEGAFYVDADHIGLANVDLFIESSNFFTLDVAEVIGQEPDEGDLRAFVHKHADLAGARPLPGVDQPMDITADQVGTAARKYLRAVQEAGRIYRHIEAAKGTGTFVVEVSMDECQDPQTPSELLVILAAISDEGIPAQTIAPKFTGRFNKGVDYVGQVCQFARQFEQDLAVIAFATERFPLPGELKLSVHSGSDKFSLYGPIREALGRFDAGLHLKTAGTTWLEELIGLATAGGEALDLAKDIYGQALQRFDELAEPYASVIDIDPSALPSPQAVGQWDSQTFADTLRHDPSCPQYNAHFRQLLHIAYKIAAEIGSRYLAALAAHEQIIARNVSENLYARHIRPLFMAGPALG